MRLLEEQKRIGELLRKARQFFSQHIHENYVEASARLAKAGTGRNGTEEGIGLGQSLAPPGSTLPKVRATLFRFRIAAGRLLHLQKLRPQLRYARRGDNC